MRCSRSPGSWAGPASKTGEWIPLDPDSGRGLVDVIKRSDGTTVDAAGGDRRFTTRELLALEQQTVSVASASP